MKQKPKTFCEMCGWRHWSAIRILGNRKLCFSCWYRSYFVLNAPVEP